MTRWLHSVVRAFALGKVKQSEQMKLQGQGGNVYGSKAKENCGKAPCACLLPGGEEAEGPIKG